MMLEIYPPSGGNERLTLVVRRPDESLHDYLVRCQWELGDRVRFLASVRDAQWTILESERQRWRRHALLLTFTGPVITALAYAALGLCVGRGQRAASAAHGRADRLCRNCRRRAGDRHRPHHRQHPELAGHAGGHGDGHERQLLRLARPVVDPAADRRHDPLACPTDRRRDRRNPSSSRKTAGEFFDPSRDGPRLPGETQEAYVERLHRSNEAALLIMTRSALAMEYTSGRDERIAALRFRQIVGLEAAAASIIVGLFRAEMLSFMRAAILVLTPIALVRGGLWFLYCASRMANALARHAERWGR